MKEKIDQGKYIGLRPDVEIKEAKAFLSGKEIGEIELDSESQPVLLALLPLLDGTRTVAGIVTELQSKEIAEAAVISCLNFLLESGFIYQFSRSQDIYIAANYAWRSPNPEEILDKLAQAQVLLQGQQNFCQLIADGLTGAGVGTKVIPTSEEWETFASFADLIILFGESWEKVLAVNSWCVKNNKPLIVGWWKNFTVSFGPILVPGVTACQACIYERQGNIAYPDISNTCQAGSYPMVVSAANLLAGICLEFLSGAGLSRALTSIHEIDIRTVTFADYPALKNPRCRVCSRLKTYPEGAVIDA
ncbi:ThiF family adenylyltransferase [Microseira wollei]|uniref:THIF-type NAD/FAD binding fold domain-containing protein n=1 Tax=Microseira wollei NIES-4236 TaxID=2530354 RepID=A0AAV3XIQ2_9CYAN|nr:hypothetical protein [Microseira wollei]GET42334.1 hypothetical protein MiSe_71500 [Microseira wollei NIES-4236]